jgi:thiol-disulfide isomerase/thioredoxin
MPAPREAGTKCVIASPTKCRGWVAGSDWWRICARCKTGRNSTDVLTEGRMFDRKEFDDLVAGAGEGLVVVDFAAAWCGPCQKMKPIFNGFADEFPKVLFVTIDTDMNAETAKACQVTVMPTFQFYKNRQLIHTIKGADPQQLRDAIITHGRDKWDSLTGGQMLSGGTPRRLEPAMQEQKC